MGNVVASPYRHSTRAAAMGEANFMKEESMYAYTVQDALRSRIEELERFITKLEHYRASTFAELVEWNIDELRAQIGALSAKIEELEAVHGS